MAVNKVEISGEVKLDLTGDTVTPETLLQGATAHDKSGAPIVGTYAPTAPARADDITFRDYDGSIVAGWSLSDLSQKAELPALPEHDGLICQGWNWTLDELKAQGTAMDVGAMYITDDGTTRIYIHLTEGRTSPILGCCPNGTVTVDWGDGTAPDTLTGSSTDTVQWTPTHSYAAPGDYVIRLSVDGEVSFTGASGSALRSFILHEKEGVSGINAAYQNLICRIEIGRGITILGAHSFNGCSSLSAITLPAGLTSIGEYAFLECRSLSAITLPAGLTSLGEAAFKYCKSLCAIEFSPKLANIDNKLFEYCYSLKSIKLPAGLTSIGTDAFVHCESLHAIALSSALTSIGPSAFQYCIALGAIEIPSSVTDVGQVAFSNCTTLASISIPNGVTSINSSTLGYCDCLASVILPGGLTSVGGTVFRNCIALAIADFSRCTSVPPIGYNAFVNTPSDCKILVPAALEAEWKAATNWKDYKDKIVGV